MSTPAPFLSRHLGDYLLVAQLSEDPLGTVFRALYAADERRFVRLRILQSEELASEAVLQVVRENRLRNAALAHDALVVRPELDVVDGIPFMTWDETAGWTLDTMLARVRAFGIRIPAEYALLIAERIAAALEHAHQALGGARAANHGLLWPGFVSISHDADVRVGGFGVAEGIVPSLGGPRMLTEITPYVAPEVRRGQPVSAQSDVYSLGAILVELMTGRRPSLDTPSAELRAGDPRSDELGAFLGRCLAEPEGRFASAVEAHRALQQMVTGNPFSLFTANLALFLYKLLNPEGQSVAPSSDWESTSPVVLETKTRRGDAAPPAEPPRRRRGDLDPSESIAPAAAPAPEPSAAPEVSTPAPAHSTEADFAPAPLFVQEHAAELIEGASDAAAVTNPPVAWRLPAAILAAAAGLAAGAFLIAGRPGNGATRTVPVPATAANASASRGAAPAIPDIPDIPAASPALDATAVVSGRLETAASHPASVPRPAKKIRLDLKQPAEDLRLRAALARIEADRVNARERASDVFLEGQQSEEQGQQMLRQRDYEAAQASFSRAAQLFQHAQEMSWAERVRDTNLSASP